MMTIKEKMVYFCQQKSITITQMAQDIKASATNFSTSNLNSTPGGDIILRFLQEYPEVSAEWLLRDDGDMLKNKHLSVSATNTGNNSTVIGVNAGAINTNNSMRDSRVESSQKSSLHNTEEALKAKDLIIQAKDEIIKSKQETIDVQHQLIIALQSK